MHVNCERTISETVQSSSICFEQLYVSITYLRSEKCTAAASSYSIPLGNNSREIYFQMNAMMRSKYISQELCFKHGILIDYVGLTLTGQLVPSCKREKY